jgi:hypothetical protein
MPGTEDTPVSSDFFVFLNEFSKNEDLVFVARVVKGNREEMRVEYFPQSTFEVQKAMRTNWQFDKKAISYQRRQFYNKGPDRS